MRIFNFQFPIFKSERGFTVIETVVVMAIFLFTIGVVVSIFISAIQNQRSVLYEQGILNQMSYAEEYMSKALRMAKVDTTGECLEDSDGNSGYVYLLTRPDVSAGKYRGIKFINQSDDDACQEFFLDTTSDPTHFVLKELKDSTNDANAVPLTGSDIRIDDISFAINGVKGTIASGSQGATNLDGIQPRLTMMLGIIVGTGSEQAVKVVQTTISQRNLNVQP